MHASIPVRIHGIEEEAEFYPRSQLIVVIVICSTVRVFDGCVFKVVSFPSFSTYSPNPFKMNSLCHLADMFQMFFFLFSRDGSYFSTGFLPWFHLSSFLFSQT